MLHAPRAVGFGVGAQTAVGVGVADAVAGRADRVRGSDVPRGVRDGFEDYVVGVVRGSARGSVLFLKEFS